MPRQTQTEAKAPSVPVQAQVTVPTADIAVDRLVRNALDALPGYAPFTQEQVDHIVKKASLAALERHTGLAVLAVEIGDDAPPHPPIRASTRGGYG